MGRGSAGEGHKSIWAGAVGPKKLKNAIKVKGEPTNRPADQPTDRPTWWGVESRSMRLISIY